MIDTQNLIRISEAGRVTRLTIERDGDEWAMSMTLTDQTGNHRINLNFRGVSGIRFRGDQVNLLGLVLLVAENISTHGWEGFRYRVKDYEEEFISFYCRSFSTDDTQA